jgi:hypothetical protein
LRFPRRYLRACGAAIAVGTLALVNLGEAAGQQPYDGASSVCESAAGQAEREWRLPQGLLAAIGVVESGRRAPTGMFPIIWPWTLNAEGQGYYQPSKAAAVGMVRSLQLRGVRVIDVGCFQVDLYYHPYAFANPEEAFDPDTNARAAARILSLGRLGNTGWDGAIAAYHSAIPLLGAAYLQKVRAVWPWIKAHSPWAQPDVSEYAVLLSPQARLVRVVTPFGPVAGSSADGNRQPDRMVPTVQWLSQPVAGLPRVITP